MDNPFPDIIKALKSLEKQANPIMMEIIKEYSPEIEDLNAEQLSRGERADGEILPDYSPTSVTVYGKPPGPIKLYDQGDFWKGIRIKLMADGFEMIGTDSKTAELERDFGKQITGLQKESIEQIEDDFIRAEIEDKYKKYLDENIKS
ncbi:MAG: hypothetical protein WD512_20220 [Candidatus Paceibacterota bacterium]